MCPSLGVKRAFYKLLHNMKKSAQYWLFDYNFCMKVRQTLII